MQLNVVYCWLRVLKFFVYLPRILKTEYNTVKKYTDNNIHSYRSVKLDAQTDISTHWNF